MERIVEQGMLYDYYGALLTKHQQEIYEMVVYENLSLNEIADLTGVSKQAVSDLVRRVTLQLENHEKKLGLIERAMRIQKNCDAMEEIINRMYEEDEARDLRAYLENIRKDV